jgi:hypothetical protein
MPGEQPDQHRDQHPEVHRRVVEIRDLGEQRVRQQQPLEVHLGGQPQRPLGVPDPLAVRDRLLVAALREVPRQLPQRVQPDHHARLAQERADVHPPPPRPGDAPEVQEQHPGRAKSKRQQCPLLPREHEVRHDLHNNRAATRCPAAKKM